MDPVLEREPVGPRPGSQWQVDGGTVIQDELNTAHVSLREAEHASPVDRCPGRTSEADVRTNVMYDRLAVLRHSRRPGGFRRSSRSTALVHAEMLQLSPLWQ